MSQRWLWCLLLCAAVSFSCGARTGLAAPPANESPANPQQFIGRWQGDLTGFERGSPDCNPPSEATGSTAIFANACHADLAVDPVSGQFRIVIGFTSTDENFQADAVAGFVYYHPLRLVTSLRAEFVGGYFGDDGGFVGPTFQYTGTATLEGAELVLRFCEYHREANGMVRPSFARECRLRRLR